jgi:glycosyltransferase involved in cell wall biosynthesis
MGLLWQKGRVHQRLLCPPVTVASPLRLVGLAQGDPGITRTGSGTAKFLLDALDRRHRVVARHSVELSKPQRYLVAAATFNPSRERWKSDFWWKHQLALRLRTRNSRRVLRRVDEPFDLVVQIFGLFHTQGAPYVVYVDNTVELSRRHWPAWVRVEGRALERLYAWERGIYREALHVFAQGSPHAESVASFYGVPEERVSVVGAGANFEVLPELPEEPREPVILFVGRDWRRKGGARLIEAFAKVRARRAEARLQIVGTDEAVGGEPGVEVLGTVESRARLAELYGRARVFCLPSLYDPLGLSILEAMAHGLPCVVTDVGARAEVVLDGDTGLIVPPDDADALATALLRLMENPEEAARLGAAGRRRVESHDNWDAVAERMIPGLERAAELARAPRG